MDDLLIVFLGKEQNIDLGDNISIVFSDGSDILEKVANMVYDYNEEEGKKIEMCLYEMAYRM